MSPLIPVLLKQLTTLDDLKRRAWGDKGTIEAVVRQHGIGKVGARAPLRPGLPKQCFYNATRLVQRDPKRWVYCEGYAITSNVDFIIGEHAWVLDRRHKDAVVELTWDFDGESAYLGIPFSPEYLLANVSRDRYGLLDNWQARWPLRTLPSQTYLHPESSILVRDFDGHGAGLLPVGEEGEDDAEVA